jgi:hypothetical protein
VRDATDDPVALLVFSATDQITLTSMDETEIESVVPLQNGTAAISFVT